MKKPGAAENTLWEEALKRYAEGPDLLEAALAGLSEGDLDACSEDGWSLRQIVHHVADADSMWMANVRIAIISPGARVGLGWHPGNRGIADALRYAHRLVGPAMALFRATREHIAQMLSGIDDAEDGFIIVVDLPEWAEVREEKITVGEYIRGLARHVDEHVREIDRIRQRW